MQASPLGPAPLVPPAAAATGPEIGAMFADLRGFIDRRISELSAELHATVELVDYSETNLTGQISKIHEQIAHLVAIPAANTRNSGVELEAVVQATEAAANTIMEAAEAIQGWIEGGLQDPESIRQLSDKVNSIFEACSFQDVTGQRIRRAIQHLQQVEEMLHGMVPGATPTPPELEPVKVSALLHTIPEPGKKGPDLAQAAIDALMDF